MRKSDLKELIREVLKEEMVKPSPEAIRFAEEIKEKLKFRIMKRGSMNWDGLDALKDIIIHKLTKEGWISKEEFDRKSSEQLPPNGV